MADFSAKVASLLASCSDAVAAIPVSAAVSLPEPASLEVTLCRALGGNVEAQVEMANLCLAVGQACDDGPCFESAETWARQAAEAGSERGEYSLASVLLYRAGVLAGNGFKRLSGELAAEALELLDQLADQGFEEAACALMGATESLAICGINPSPNQQEGWR